MSFNQTHFIWFEVRAGIAVDPAIRIPLAFEYMSLEPVIGSFC
jgi:hypothetical protein